ncbi:MAG: sulfide/dihydroorotate dehydrogenase-like FAD/NAD-binding protein [Clostridium sp.]|jgi:ferredoxin--NADP+ reductase|nr:sulfide/dihydroorotate dehydrogenase-like FAD/NAD-binding protein [Clostridium sp.]MDD7138680.1 sulfide/dihydroorotate dehydrogenase-like FAD/NAD-binding protein [Clostridium sp.]MDO4343159.1 sulfide/dihydroorotate dehydrogenase-like FAD/NAD-binding protein [Eubacteriales bacterium]MDY6080805.1 sulfide/dihydroorotate dehydrogenase-like FAD/NAD-binding protein [Eubacteriales bacterium]
MFRIVTKRPLHDTVTLMEIEAPAVAKKALPGQFIILRIDEEGERIPLTVAGTDKERGTVTIIFQKVGYTTKKLDLLNEGDALLDFVGPLGRASELEGMKRVAVIGGGLGVAIAYPQAKALHEMGAEVDVIVGFRSTDLMILMDELKAASTNLYVMTDDGSNGHQGFVTTALEEQLKAGVKYDHVIAIGPLVMMRAVCKLTKEYNIPTIVSMNPIMIDGTGMCGCCRVTVDGKMKFACVDGPDFDGQLIDWDEAISRSRMYKKEEQQSMEKHACNLKNIELQQQRGGAN